MPRMSRRSVVFLALSLLVPVPVLTRPVPQGEPPRGYGLFEWREDTEVCALERSYLDAGLVDVQDVDPTILVDLKYARPDNFMGEPVYGTMRKCYLQPEAATLLGQASRLLDGHRPGLRLLVADGARPRSVQRRMWEMVRGTPMQPYVADPATGSMHNFGAAVDLTLATPDGSALDMGTGMDHFGVLAQPREEVRLFGKGLLTAGQIENRKLLRQVMTGAGFRPLPIEWWHFDAFGREETRRRFRIIE
jgi:zinc D-Ala-D-Ala dipeptidase